MALTAFHRSPLLGLKSSPLFIKSSGHPTRCPQHFPAPRFVFSALHRLLLLPLILVSMQKATLTQHSPKHAPGSHKTSPRFSETESVRHFPGTLGEVFSSLQWAGEQHLPPKVPSGTDGTAPPAGSVVSEAEWLEP